MTKTPIAVTIAGSDSGGGAGIQADLKAFSALGVYGASVIAAMTAQNTREVRSIHDVPVGFITDQIDAVFEDLDVDAVKIGMLSQPAVIDAVADGLDRHGVDKVVLDPVMVAKSGDKLLVDEAVVVLRSVLLPKAVVVTPNIPEAGVLLGIDEDEIASDPESACRELIAMGARAVLLKGGHGTGDESTDWLVGNGIVRTFTAPRIPTKNTHGTGCTLSSAIAAGLAKGLDVETAVEQAKAYIAAAIAAADDLAIGHGHGPVHHFHALWQAGT
jgi:hydroxymethylpyrimidine/phosphomethylpyrimidine kinase